MMEVLPWAVDVNEMKQHLVKNVFPLGPAVIQGEEYGFDTFGGWSVQSRTGEWADGWQITRPSHDYTDEQLFDLKYRGVGHPMEHVHPTAANTGYLKFWMDKIESAGFYPRRARITVVRPNTHSVWHQDAADDQYGVRLHIPIVTNNVCFHHVQDCKPFHMDAGKVYVICVNNVHRIINNSVYNRFHLIMDVYDTQHFCNSSTFHYKGNILERIAAAGDFRRRIDAL